jgi:hypothetical protein
VEHERFFYALPSILLYGVFGTLASFAIISIFMYGALGFALFKLEVRGSCHKHHLSCRGFRFVMVYSIVLILCRWSLLSVCFGCGRFLEVV